MFNFALGIFLFLSPIIVLVGFPARVNGQVMALQFYQFKTMSFNNNILQFQFFQYGIIALFILALSRKPIREFRDKYFAGFLGLCALSVLFHPKTINAFLPIFLGSLLYYLVVAYTVNIKPLLYSIIFVSILNTIAAVLQFFGIPVIYKYAGLMCSMSHLGTYQAIAIPVCWAINPYLSIIPLIGLLLSKSLTPLAALLVGLVYLWYPQRRKIIINLALIGLIALTGISIVFLARVSQSATYKFSLRADIWLDVIRQIFRYPWIGAGLGTFSVVTPMGFAEWIYNEYLSIAFYAGIPALICLMMFLKDKFTFGRVDLSRCIVASCLILAIICLGQSPMHFVRIAGAGIVLLGFAEITKMEVVI